MEVIAEVLSQLTLADTSSSATVAKKTDAAENNEKDEGELLNRLNTQQQIILPKIIITSESTANDLCNLDNDLAKLVIDHQLRPRIQYVVPQVPFHKQTVIL
uniref:Uncharacterized protein n=1 Tax=Syphacia muris TaxID=451379 RepID=A0A0N5AUE3_9BILA